MGQNIHALRFDFKRGSVGIRVLSKSRRGSTFTLRGLTLQIPEGGLPARQTAVKEGVASALERPTVTRLNSVDLAKRSA